MKISIDVIIPSFRLSEKYIVPLLQLSKPQNTAVKFYIIVDNPSIKPAISIKSILDNENAFLIINDRNIGAAETRNNGINAGTGDWVLFLDDDIIPNENLLKVYADAIEKNPGEIGFIGLINFPEPASTFTKAIKASGSMDIFSIALRKKTFAWGATANIMVLRSAIGDLRFSPEYPKSGGGEDVDFFLRVRKRNDFKNFMTLPNASVAHPWWRDETVDFKRPFRYGKGNSLLGYLNPEYAYYDFFNTPEILLISLLVTPVLFFIKLSWVMPVLIFIAGVLIIEILASSIQTLRRYRKWNLKVMMYVMMLRLVHEWGVLSGKISGLQLWRIGERFHDDGSINKIYFYRSNTYKIVKWILYPVMIFFILRRYA